MTDKLFCSNCKHPISEQDRFCSMCGQSVKSFRQPFIPFVKESFFELLDIDGRLSRTLKTLIFKPGLAALEFDQGKRTKYTPPLRLYLVISVIFFLVLSTFLHAVTGGVIHSESAINQYSRAMFILFPIFALYVKLFYRDSYFVSNLVFSMHMHSVGYVVLTFIGPMEAMEERHQMFLLMQGPPALYFAWYFVMSFKTMYQQSWLLTLVKAAAIYMVYMGTLGLVFDVVLGSDD